MSSALAKINREVKRQKKLHPSMSHKAAQKKAGAAYRAGKLGKVRKGAVKKRVGKPSKKKSVGKRPSRRVGAARRASNGQDRYDSKRVNITVGSVASQESRLKHTLAERIGYYEMMAVTAKTAKTKNRLRAKINVLKHKLRKLE